MARLSLVPTPIGNLADISLRALETLKTADVIAAEDTRHSRKLLSHYAIDKPLVRLDAYTIEERANKIFDEHEHIAFISDAGTPGISDPGAELVRLALERGMDVEVLPGATAFVPALVLSGLDTARFRFEGFLPRKGSSRKERVETIANSDVTSIFYESPKRLLRTLADLLELCPERQASVSRELTKRFETTYRGSIQTIHSELSQTEVKGECVVVVAAREEEQGVDARALARKLVHKGLQGKALRDALREQGVARNEAYELSLEFSKRSEPAD